MSVFDTIIFSKILKGAELTVGQIFFIKEILPMLIMIVITIIAVILWTIWCKISDKR